MSDYIDRNLLLAEIKELKKSPWYNGCGENYDRIVRSDAIGTVVDLCISSAPAADVQEVKHGEWIMTCNGDYYYCSECLNYKKPIDREFFYCPHCGAKMDGGEEK